MTWNEQDVKLRNSNINYAMTSKDSMQAEMLQPRHFLVSISLVYLEYYYHEKMAWRNISLKLLSLSNERIGSVVAVMTEQNNNDQLDGTTNETEYKVRSDETELFYDLLIDSTVGHINDLSSRPFQASDWAVNNESLSTLMLLVFVDSNGDTPSSKSRGEKPETEENTFLQRLEKAHAKARSRDDWPISILLPFQSFVQTH